MPEPWLSADDIVAHLGITKDTVDTWIAEKHMPAHKMGRLWKVRTSDIDEWGRRGAGSREDEQGPHAWSNVVGVALYADVQGRQSKKERR